MENSNSEIIKMVDNAMKVLDILRGNDTRLGVNEIAKTCSISPSTTCRILKTLERGGWVFQLSDERYIAGEKISFLLSSNNLYLALRDVAGLVMNRHTKEMDQGMNLMVREGASCYVIQQSKTNSIINHLVDPFCDLPYYACAGGKILLSELPEPLVDEIIRSCEMKPITPNTVTDPDIFKEELRQVAKLGYAYDDKESSKSGSCIAVPVRDRENRVVAGLSFSGFVGIDDKTVLLSYLPSLLRASEEISDTLYRSWKR